MDLSHVSHPTPRLLLKSFQEGDAAEAFAAVTPTLCRYLAFDPAPNPDAFAEVWRGWLADMTAGRLLILAIRRAETGEFLGLTGLHDIASGTPETGFWIKEAAHGQGFGGEAVAAALAWGGERLGAPFVHYHVAQANTPSRRIAERLGGVVIETPPLRKASGVELPGVRYRVPIGPSRPRASD